jgi:hypothetical protein
MKTGGVPKAHKVSLKSVKAHPPKVAKSAKVHATKMPALKQAGFKPMHERNVAGLSVHRHAAAVNKAVRGPGTPTGNPGVDAGVKGRIPQARGGVPVGNPAPGPTNAFE